MELRTRNLWLRTFILTISIAWACILLAACPAIAFAKTSVGSLIDPDSSRPQLSVFEQEQTDAARSNRPGENDNRLAKRLAPVRVNTLQPEPPIIFLPGVAGTRLYKRYGDASREIWPLPLADDRDQIKMSMDVNGLPLDKNIVPGDIIRSVLPKLHRQIYHVGVYADLLESIQSREFEKDERTWSYKEGENLFVWGYDWRLDNAEHLINLDKFINQVRMKTKSKKVILIAHSMGGLISRAYAVKHPDKVEAIISIGSPFAGSPKPFYALVMGYTFGNPFYYKRYMKNLVQNSPSTYQLLPQYDFVIDSLADFRKIPNQELYDKLKYKDIRMSGFQSVNKILLQRAVPFYRSVGTSFNPAALPSSVKHYAIIGVGIQTLEGFLLRQVSSTDKSYLDYAGQRVVLDPFFGNGDGTVPLKSADIRNTTRTYFIRHGEGYDSSGIHGSLPNNREVQGIVRSILLGSPYRITGSSAVTKLVDIEPDEDFTLK